MAAEWKETLETEREISAFMLELGIPAHLRDAHYKSAAKLGHGIGYQYSHDYENHYVRQQYLPDEIKDAVFYEASDNGYEQTIKAHMKRIKDEA